MPKNIRSKTRKKREPAHRARGQGARGQGMRGQRARGNTLSQKIGDERGRKIARFLPDFGDGKKWSPAPKTHYSPKSGPSCQSSGTSCQISGTSGHERARAARFRGRAARFRARGQKKKMEPDRQNPLCQTIYIIEAPPILGVAIDLREPRTIVLAGKKTIARVERAQRELSNYVHYVYVSLE